MKVKCVNTINAWEDGTGRLFTKDKVYNFIPVDNRYTRVIMKDYKFIGYVEKDDEGYKRWMGKEFKESNFIDTEGI